MLEDQPNGRPQWRFTVFAQDEGGEGLVGYADVQVNLKDINDNAPIFPQGIYFGNVTENGTAVVAMDGGGLKGERRVLEGTHQDSPEQRSATVKFSFR
uniref:(California timema) hypothetical protein n=1 Tax=Timema californicum TaxID=61474 RepID=A0A7R9JKP4_TIMCA|nr:unnamed protein product [Timema californicum]